MFGVPTQRDLQVGVYMAADGIAVAEVDFSAEKRPALQSCHYIETDQPAEQLRQLGRYVRDHALKRRSCIVVLDESSYNLIQMDAPPVQDDELVAALRWSVKDLIDYPIDDAVIDVFRENCYVIADSNHGYKMIGVGKLVAGEICERPSELLKPFRFSRYAEGKLHPVSHSPFPWS